MKVPILDHDGVFTGFSIEGDELHCYEADALDYLRATKGVASKAAIRQAIAALGRELGIAVREVD